MAKTASKMVELGTQAPGFSLPDTQGNLVSLDSFADAPALLVVFMCNHCPFVIHVREKLAELTAAWMEQGGVAVVGINSNDAQAYPADSPQRMAEEKKKAGYVFAYLYDETQAVARAYDAACTPDFFLFDSQRRLAYRGQFDDSRPGNGVEVSGADLARAVRAVLAGEPPVADQKPSIGCNIKWKTQPAF